MVLKKDYIIEYDLQLHGALDAWGEFIRFVPTVDTYIWPLAFWVLPNDGQAIECGSGTEQNYHYNYIYNLPLDTTMKLRLLVVGAKRWIWINDQEIVYDNNMGTRQELEVDFYFNYGYSPGLVSVKNLWLMEVNFLEFTIESGDMFIPTQHNMQLADDLILEADFEFECEVQTDEYLEGDRNIFRFTNTETNEGHYGDRSLMVNAWNFWGDMWIDIYTDSTEDTSGHLNYFMLPSYYFTLKVRVQGDYREVFVDGNSVLYDYVGARHEQRRARFYASDGFFDSAGVSLRNVRWTNLFE